MKSANFKYFLALCPVGVPPISFCVIAYLNIHISHATAVPAYSDGTADTQNQEASRAFL
jgi:hypothetical protein